LIWKAGHDHLQLAIHARPTMRKKWHVHAVSLSA